jgi:hypothetical protein
MTACTGTFLLAALTGLAALPATSGQVVTTAPPSTTTAAAPPRGHGAISGVVIAGVGGTPIADAVVSLVALSGFQLPAEYQPRQMTDARGRFAFLNLPDNGQFQITAAKFGFLDGGYGRDSGPTDALRPIAIANGSWAGNLRVSLWAPGAISGSVRDERGEPVVGVIVRSLARVRVAGRDELAAGPLALTDDRGQYRISGLFAGRYLIQVPSVQMAVPAATRVAGASGSVPEGAIDVDDTARLVIGRYPLPPPSSSGRTMSYAIAFHPTGSSPAEAGTVEVRFGEDRPGVDVTLTPVPAVRVSGIVEAPPEALTGLTLRLLPSGLENAGLGGEVATALVGAGGAFTFLNVPTGTYVLDAPLTFNQFSMASGPTSGGGMVSMGGGVSLPTPPPRSGWSSSGFQFEGAPGVSMSVMDFRGASGTNVPKYSGRTSLAVGTSDLTGVVVRLRPNAVLRGRITMDMDPARAGEKPPRLSIFMDAANGQPGLGRPSTSVSANPADFELVGIQPAEYFLRIQGSTSWVAKSINWRGRDYTNTPFDATATDDFSGVQVVVTNMVPTLTGTVRLPDGALAGSNVVVIFPVQSALRTNTGLWPPRLTSAALRSDGTYRFPTLPAGDYFVAAIERSRLGTWRDPESLAALERQASRVTLTWGQAVTQDLTVVR